MLIDWFTVCAQALNFLILVWLMKHFLYKPILAAVDAREKRIAAELAEAATKKAEAAHDRDEYQKKVAEIEAQKSSLLEAAQAAAKAEHQHLTDQARAAADTLAAKRQDELRHQAEALDQAFRRRIQQEVFAVARLTLHDLAGVDLEDRLVGLFTTRLRDLDTPTKEALGKAIAGSADPVQVRCAIALPPGQIAVIQTALNQTFAADIHLRYVTAPDLIAGIEMTAQGQKLSWSIAGYLTVLESMVGDLLQEQDQRANPTTKKPGDDTAKPTNTPAAKVLANANPVPTAPAPIAPTPPPAPKTQPA